MFDITGYEKRNYHDKDECKICGDKNIIVSKLWWKGFSTAVCPRCIDDFFKVLKKYKGAPQA